MSRRSRRGDDHVGNAALRSNLKRRALAPEHATSLLSLPRSILQLCFLRMRFTRKKPYTPAKYGRLRDAAIIILHLDNVAFYKEAVADEHLFAENHYQDRTVARLRLVCRAMWGHFPWLLVRARFMRPYGAHIVHDVPGSRLTMFLSDKYAPQGKTDKYASCSKLTSTNLGTLVPNGDADTLTPDEVALVRRGVAYRLDAGYPVRFYEVVAAAVNVPLPHLHAILERYVDEPHSMVEYGYSFEADGVQKVAHTRHSTYAAHNVAMALEFLLKRHRFAAVGFLLETRPAWWTEGDTVRFGERVTHKLGEADFRAREDAEERQALTRAERMNASYYMHVGRVADTYGGPWNASAAFYHRVLSTLYRHGTAQEIQGVLETILRVAGVSPEEWSEKFYMLSRGCITQIQRGARLCAMQWIHGLQQQWCDPAIPSVAPEYVYEQWFCVCNRATLPAATWFWDTFVAPRKEALLPIQYGNYGGVRTRRNTDRCPTIVIIFVRDPAVLAFMLEHCPPPPLRPPHMDPPPEDERNREEYYTPDYALELDGDPLGWDDKCCSGTR